MKSLRKLYAHAPIALQHVMVSGQGLNYRLRRASTPIMRAHLAFLLESQHWTPQQFERYQSEKLRETMRVAFEQVPHYQRLAAARNLSADDFQSPADIRKLPILEKEDVRGNEDAFLNETADKSSLYHGHTSGTTGTPLHLYESKESFSLRWAYIVRLRQWTGLEDPLYPRRAQFTGREIVPDTQAPARHVYWRHNVPGNALLFSTTHLTPQTVPHYAEALCDFEPELIDGYPSAMLIIARISRRHNIELPQPKAIISTAETLPPEHREEIERAFQTGVFDQYAASEPSCLWGECEHGTLHVSPEYGIGEIVDEGGEPAAPGEVGEIVVTSFLNRSMMLLRYRVGDLAVAGKDTPCACGRYMPSVERIEGRRDDILYVPERGYVGRLDPVFKGLHHIIEAQIVQEEFDRVRVRVVPGASYDQAEEEKLRRNLTSKLGDGTTLRIEQVHRIPRGANGKFRSVVSRVKDQYPDRM